MATVYLCIGTMKTGTTTLQTVMSENAEALSKQGYCYPLFPVCGSKLKARNGHFLIYEDTTLPEQDRKEKSIAVRSKCLNKIKKLAEQYDNIVLSEELIWHYSRKNENFWIDTQEMFREIGCDLKIVVYLRRQDELIQSLWNQNVKRGTGIALTFHEYLDKKMYSYFPFRYHKKLSQISEQMGKENIIVRVYEDGQYEGEHKDLLSDFFYTLGISYTDDFVIQDMGRNPGINGNYIEMKRIINGVLKKNEIDDIAFKPMLSASSYMSLLEGVEKTSMFTYEEQVEFMKTYQKGNELVAREFLGREDGILFRKPIKKMPAYSVDKENMYRDMLVFMTELFCDQERRLEKLEKEISTQKNSNGQIVGGEQNVYQKIKRKIKAKLKK